MVERTRTVATAGGKFGGAKTARRSLLRGLLSREGVAAVLFAVPNSEVEVRYSNLTHKKMYLRGIIFLLLSLDMEICLSQTVNITRLRTLVSTKKPLALANIKTKLKKLPEYRIVPLIGVVTGFILVGVIVMSNFAATEPIHPDGTLIRDNRGTLTNTADDKIYLIQSNKKRLVPDDKILLSQGYSKAQIKDATKGDLAMQDGKNLTFKEGTIMFGADFSPYVVDNFDLNILGNTQNKDQARFILDDISTLMNMGYSYDILRALFAGIVTSNFPEKGLPIKNVRTHFDGIFVRSGKDYYIIENKNALSQPSKRPIPNPYGQDVPTILKSYDFDLRSQNLLSLQKIKQATQEDLALPTLSQKLDYREGTLLKGSGNSKFIVDSDNLGIKNSVREFDSDNTFNALGYNINEVITIPDSELNTYPRGPKVQFNGIIVAAPKPPISAPVANPTKATAPAEISFDGSASKDPDGSITKYQWDFGDSVNGEGVKVSHNFTKAGVYNVKLTVTDNSGLVASQTIAITLDAAVASLPPSAGSPGAGYVIWDSATWSPEHLAGMQRQKPGMIRWAVTWDRHLADETKHIINPFNGFQTITWPTREPTWHGTNRNTEADKFFKQLKASCSSNYGGTGFDINNESSWGSYDAKRCTTLVVSQHGVKAGPWDWPASIGACPSGPASTCHWPDFNSGRMANYMQELYDILRSYLPKDKIVWEDYNEADLRWGSQKSAVPLQQGAMVNYTAEWTPIQKGGTNYIYGSAPYTGGTGENWTKMHQLVKDKAGSTATIPYASGDLVYQYIYEPENEANCPLLPGSTPSQKYCRNEDWIKATAPLVAYSSLHLYGDYNYMTAGPITGRPGSDFVSIINDNLDVWKKYKGYDMPFYIGETGPTSDTNVSNLALDKPQSIALTERNTFLQDAKLSPRTAGKYMGLTYLGFVGKYRVDPWKTRYGWWDSRFDPDDVITTP